MIFRLVYCSRSTIDGTSANIVSQVEDILRACRLHNEKHFVTGVLFFNGEAFAQILEGPRDSVNSLFAKIATDTRHTNVLLLERDSISERAFRNWSMAYVYDDKISSRFETLKFDEAILDPGDFAARLVVILKAVVDRAAV